MGSGESKGSSPRAGPGVTQQVMITSAVTERWVAPARTGRGRKQEPEEVEMKEMKTSPLDIKFEASGGSDESEVGGTSDQKLVSESDLDEGEDKEKADGSSEDEEKKVSESESPDVEVPAEIKDGYEESNDDKLPEKMEIFADILALGRTTGTPKAQNDIESGGDSADDQDNYAPMDEPYFLASPSHQFSLPSADGDYRIYQLPEYEEVNEMLRRDAKLDEMEEEENEKDNAMIATLQAEEPMKKKAFRIPKSILPVVIDDEEDGETRIQTITAWRYKERFEEELVKNDDRWAEEMRNLTTKFEDSTMKHAENIDRRIQELGTKYPDIVAASSATELNGAPCNGLATQIGKCYEKNKNQKLVCHSLIRQFAQCTNKSIKENFMKV